MPPLLDKVLRIGEGKQLRKLEAAAAQVNAIEDDFVSMSDEELRAQTGDFKERYADGESSTSCCPRRSRRSARRPSASSGSGTSTSS